jgi:MinD superfamily P-loop ATPase
MRQLAVISGKGGTGKTSIVASFAVLADRAVLADCDVDAADLHLVMDPLTLEQRSFLGAGQAMVDSALCTGCGVCRGLCRFGAISINESPGGAAALTATIDPLACEGCGVCAWFCEERAIELRPVANGEWFQSETRHGPMVHARLAAAAENSGKLVSLVRSEARAIADMRQLDVVIIDGAPGVGCPVIASVTGADLVLVVTEPTLSGLHDLERVLGLAEHFDVPAMVLVNKYDLNELLAREAEDLATRRGARLAGRIRYDRAVTDAQIRGLATVEYCVDGAASDIRDAWTKVAGALLDRQPARARAKG